MTLQTLQQVTGAYLSMIRAELDRSDQIIDHDLDPSLTDKDQIRSDLDQGNNVETKFRVLAAKHGIDLEDVELSTIERNMFWFVNNIESVRYPAAYIRKMVRDCGARKRIGFQPSKKLAEDSEEKEVTEIYGYPVEDLDKMAPYFDYSTYTAILDALPAATCILFRSFEEVRSSRVKLRVLLAEGKRRGVL